MSLLVWFYLLQVNFCWKVIATCNDISHIFASCIVYEAWGIYIIWRNIFVIMETLWNLLYLLEPAPVTLIVTAVVVTFASAFRALNYGKEMERNRDFSEASITLDSSQALMIPVMSSCSLLLMFYLFSSVSQLLTAFTAFASVSSLFFWLSPYAMYIKSQLGLSDPFLSRCCSKSFTRIQGLLLVACAMTVVAWLISGHWVLNNLLGISICIAFVSHVRLPNIKICAMLLVCLFVYDIFWVFFSERFFGANVMVAVATQQASNPVHTVANSLNLPGLQLITKKLELPVKIVFPRNLLGGVVPGVSASDFMMLGLGDMVQSLPVSTNRRKSCFCQILTFLLCSRRFLQCFWLWSFALTIGKVEMWWIFLI